MEISRLITEMENRLKSLLDELEFLRGQAKKLEEENKELWARLGGPDAASGGAVLNDLYAEGFHVCPAEYGKPRSRHQECIFCQHVLARSKAGGPDHGAP